MIYYLIILNHSLIYIKRKKTNKYWQGGKNN